MKINVEIDCTPAEARQFLGLPDIAPVQDKVMKELEKKMLENISTMDPETFVKTWMPLTMESLGEMQKLFWAQMGVNPDPSGGGDSKS